MLYTRNNRKYMEQNYTMGREKTIKRSIVIAVIVSILLIIASSVLYALIFRNGAISERSGIKPNEDYRLTSYDVTIDVDEYRTCTVTEKIIVQFDVMAAGITRYIPQDHYVYRADGTKDVVRAKVQDFQVVDNGAEENQVYSKSVENNYLVVELGYSNKRNQSIHNYCFTYKYVLGNDAPSDYDEFYYNVIGVDWDCKILSATFTVTLPKEYDYDMASNVGATYGSHGSTKTLASAGTFDVSNVDGRTVMTGSISNLDAFEGVTVRAVMPEGYFSKTTDRTALDLIIGMVLAISIVLVAFIVWRKYGKDEEITPVVNFYPPKGMNPLNLEFYYRTQCSTKGVTGMIVYLASKGYIKIEAVDEKGKTFNLIKVKDYDGKDASEKKLMEELFLGRDTISTDDLEDVLYDYSVATFSKTNSSLAKAKLYDRSLPTPAKLLIGLYGALAGVAIGLMTYFMIGFFSTLITMFFVGLSLAVFATIIPMAIKSVGSTLGRIMLMFILSLACAFANFNLLAYAGLGTWFVVFTTLGFVSIVLGASFLMFIDRRTQEYTAILGDVYGFRDFIENVEKDKMETLVDEDPAYFYNVLPFTYVLDVSDKWIKNLDYIHVAPPEWFVGNTMDVRFGLMSFNTTINTTTQAVRTRMLSNNVAVKAISSAISGSGRGGGFGGGGFSGGGSGGGGGSMR